MTFVAWMKRRYVPSAEPAISETQKRLTYLASRTFSNNGTVPLKVLWLLIAIGPLATVALSLGSFCGLRVNENSIYAFVFGTYPYLGGFAVTVGVALFIRHAMAWAVAVLQLPPACPQALPGHRRPGRGSRLPADVQHLYRSRQTSDRPMFARKGCPGNVDPGG